ncbi:PQQ-dependent sugar dehydrogenase [Steroidobacter cummioxidans]|uniref:PQQ-dependent sugar dehydrogenase n=1 Tax=Steroidobacter cummioxidans TaxID=1803913 RepID=UPI00137A9067|nr:PQQ-dependent sugar dehydrogenase [Steroidobacter cummioxidans]
MARLAQTLLLLAGLQACGGGSSNQDGQAPPPAAGQSGLDARPANATCTAWPRPSAGSDIFLSRFTNLSFTMPVALLQPPNDSSRWFVVQQNGLVRQFSGTNPTSASTFIDISGQSSEVGGGEAGLLGMAFHPNYPADNRVFLAYTHGTPIVLRVSSFSSSDGGATLSPASESILLSINKPFDNHNGGNIAFGPDGYLYIGVGDGGGGGDRHGDRGNGQRLTTMLGKMLRIDVNGAAPYAIPPTNPYASNALCPAAGRASGECPEIYAYGFRNPWRWSFDRENGDLWVGDVGQSELEEVDLVTLGGNYGWRCREGDHDFNTPGTPGCSTATLIDPVAQYDHTLGIAVTGGYVYRGSQNTGLLGRYLFGDFGSGRIWAWIAENATRPREPTQLLDTNFAIASFGQGNDGELYAVDYGGTLQRIDFATVVGTNPAPRQLSATGCVSSADPKQPATGLIPYAINAQFWSDGADKDRWIALPDGQRISTGNDGDWSFPNGTVLMKNFRIGTRLIETRLFMRHPDGVWGGFSYEWNAEQTQATLLEGGAVRDLGGGRSWMFPSEGQCLDCHTQAAGRSLGLETAQLNRSLTYPQTNRSANELTTLSHIGVLTPTIADPSTQPALPDPLGTTGTISDRARAYLHTNCSQCHRPGSTAPTNLDFRYTTPLIATNACNAVPQAGDVGLGSNARVIAPGSSANSVLVNRMNRRDSAAMPPLASLTADAAGVSLVSQWIDSLSSCQ